MSFPGSAHELLHGKGRDKPVRGTDIAVFMSNLGMKEVEMNEQKASFRLETPHMAGYRFGMTSSSAIGHRLHRVYGLPADMPREIGTLLQILDKKTGQTG